MKSIDVIKVGREGVFCKPEVMAPAEASSEGKANCAEKPYQQNMQEGIELHILPWYNLKNQAIPGQCPASSSVHILQDEAETPSDRFSRMEQPDASHREINALENRLKKQ
jgi:hypothetical protein